ncbi:hypothetical protein AWB64_02639 [Caballeronia sordidicola]|uniref:Uncharacterized protein n=1 Tax=Caballeronia sordidicola TaxID=196367 RepID=A0A158GDE4_CABSO|nr:hypothetical protein AWB64_02639 [Caballeronia sordidicola]
MRREYPRDSEYFGYSLRDKFRTILLSPGRAVHPWISGQGVEMNLKGYA